MTQQELSLSAYWPRRYSVSALAVLAMFVCYMDRVNISIAIIPMAEALDWSPEKQGLVLSSFFIGYLLTQVLGGRLADRFGAKLVLGAAVVIWSIFTFLTPIAAATGFAVLILGGLGSIPGATRDFPRR